MAREEDTAPGCINRDFEKGFDRGLDKGLELGQRIGELWATRAAILDVLVERFGTTRKVVITRGLESIDSPTTLRFLLKKSVKVATLEDFERLFDEEVREARR